ncbi:methyltransferase domain-containing protein [Streptomyces sp. NPDC059009]|uniref:methyltransferase domain-containing protein n=1 Tax=Streptomyces sp. NPDC059009 TaxID=3346694 RepID=UPI0036CB69DF
MRAQGVDLDERMVAIARRRRPRLAFSTGDALHLPFEDGSFGGYRADKVLHDCADPAAVVREARRVLAPGGRAVLIGRDWDGLLVDADDAGLTRALVHARADLVKGPRTARRYRALLLDAGFRDVAVEAHLGVFTDAAALPVLTGVAEAVRAAGLADPDDCREWIGEQERRARADRLFLAVPLVVAHGQRGG